MCKNETIKIGLILCMASALHAEIPIGLLRGIVHNGDLRLVYRNQPMRCEPFGIILLEQLEGDTKAQECKTAFNEFYQSNPHAKQFAKEHLHLEQSYHFEMLSKGCVLYSNGMESYSEMLLKNGIAIADEKFDNREWNAKLRKAQQGAERQNRGLYGSEMLKKCIFKEK